MRHQTRPLGNSACILPSLLVAGMILSLAACSSSSNSTPPPPPPTGTVNFVYTANAGSPSTVSALSSNQTSGVLSSISGSPYNTTSGSWAVKADPAGKFVYVANRLSGDISAFSINPSTGALSSIAGSPFPVEAGVVGIAIDPSRNLPLRRQRVLRQPVGVLDRQCRRPAQSRQFTSDDRRRSHRFRRPHHRSLRQVSLRYIRLAVRHEHLCLYPRPRHWSCQPHRRRSLPYRSIQLQHHHRSGGEIRYRSQQRHQHILWPDRRLHSRQRDRKALGPRAPLPIHTGSDPSSLTMDPSGKSSTSPTHLT
jgi:lactonase family protein with 7-bladed beta-propeller